jgi:hypothetical protein
MHGSRCSYTTCSELSLLYCRISRRFGCVCTACADLSSLLPTASQKRSLSIDGTLISMRSRSWLIWTLFVVVSLRLSHAQVWPHRGANKSSIGDLLTGFLRYIEAFPFGSQVIKHHSHCVHVLDHWNSQLREAQEE